MKKLFLFTLFLCISILPCCSQSYTYKAKVQDIITNKGISGVQVYLDNDTVGFKSNEDSTFSVQARKGSVIRLRRNGYQWLNVEIQEQTLQLLKMTPSPVSDRHDKITAIVVDGKALPKEEWDDIHPDYIKNVEVLYTDDSKFKLIINTK